VCRRAPTWFWCMVSRSELVRRLVTDFGRRDVGFGRIIFKS
jgi:hypothetical protein